MTIDEINKFAKTIGKTSLDAEEADLFIDAMKVTSVNSFEAPKLSIEEYVKQTKSFMNTVTDAYNDAWINRVLTNKEQETANDCENCDACGFFKKGDQEGAGCEMDRENGDCYERMFDNEAFSESIEIELFSDQGVDVFNLINCTIIDNTTP